MIRSATHGRRPWILPLLLLAFLGVPSPSRAQEPADRVRPAPALPRDSAILALLQQRVAEGRSAGIVVGLLEPNGSTRVLAWGDPGPGRPPLDGNSVFEIGSITKVFTAVLLADMAERGEVALDDPVQAYLPDGVRMPTRSGKPITLAMLSEQTSGLPRLPTNLRPQDAANPYADYSVRQLYDFLSGYSLPRDPGERYEYSNLGVGLLGHVLALRAGKPYEALVRERILEPLGMHDTSISLAPRMRERLALGHDELGNVVPNWDAPTLAGAGALRSTATDMLAFLDANLHPERGPLERSMAVTHPARARAGSDELAIGLGWHRLRSDDDPIVWHNGGTGGYRAFAGFRPDRGTGVVVLTNSGGAGADDIGFHLLDAALPLAPPPPPRRTFTEISLPAELLERYVGIYELGPELRIEVTRSGDALFGQPTGQPRVRLWPYAETEFFVREVDAQVSFVRDAAGTVTGLVLHQGGRDVPGRRVGR